MTAGILKCVQCPEPAECRFLWTMSQGPQAAELCANCASAAWQKFKNTSAFSALAIEDLHQ